MEHHINIRLIYSWRAVNLARAIFSSILAHNHHQRLVVILEGDVNPIHFGLRPRVIESMIHMYFEANMGGILSVTQHTYHIIVWELVYVQRTFQSENSGRHCKMLYRSHAHSELVSLQRAYK